jgi:negative regulator of sigma E activity
MQKEKLSALMDGETLDNELLNELSRSSEMQKTWESYHLIRDTLRGDTAEVLHFDISARVMAAIENEPVRQTAPLIPESQPAPHQWRQMPFWKKCVRGPAHLPRWALPPAYRLRLSSASSTIMGSLIHLSSQRRRCLTPADDG